MLIFLRHLFLTLIALLSLAAPVAAADVHVAYLVDARTLVRTLRASSSLVVTLYDDGACSMPVLSRVVPAADIATIEKLHLMALKDVPKPPRTVRIAMNLDGVSLPAPAWVTIAGVGIAPVGSACQHAGGGAALGVGGGCPPDAVAVGPTCVDRYEASVWRLPAGDTALLRRVRYGAVTLADLVAGGATQVRGSSTASCIGEEYPPTFPEDGNYTEPLYAVSVAGVLPSNCLTPHQAFAACALSGKRLPTGIEFYHAQVGTPPPLADDGVTSCAVSVPAPVATGSRSACVSTVGAHDLIGNLYEWTTIFETDLDQHGRAWSRGGAFNVGTGFPPSLASLHPAIAVHTDTGFRCVR